MTDSPGLFPSPHGEQQRLPHGADRPAEASPLDVPKEFAEAPSYRVRDELGDLVRRDLLGPWDGEAEAFRPGAPGPRERYLVGMLGPKPAAKSAVDDAGEVPDTESGVQSDGSEGDLPEVFTPQNLGRIWASSMGLSFTVPADVDVIAVTTSWGEYAKRETEVGDGRRHTAWAREPVRHQRGIRLDGQPSFREPLTGDDPDQPSVYLAVSVRARDNGRVVELALVNAQAEPERTPGHRVAVPNQPHRNRARRHRRDLPSRG